MSRVETAAAGSPHAAPSPQYLDWLRQERRTRLTIRLSQIALLVAFLVLWEVLPRLQLINPLFTSYPSRIWPTFVEMLKATPQQASILAHTWSTVLATVVGFTLAILLGTAIAAAASSGDENSRLGRGMPTF